MTNTVLFPGLGLSFTVSRVAFYIGDFAIYWYGVIIACGLMLALCHAFYHASEFGIDSDRMTDVLLVGVVMGVVSARAMYVLFSPFPYESLAHMLDIRDGGLAIYGGIIGGFLFGGLACWARKVPVLPMFDVVSMSFLIGQSIGRWGNFFNQEAFGNNTSLPWGMLSETTTEYLAYRQDYLATLGVVVDPSMPVHPTFLYESLWCFFALLILHKSFKKRRFHGDVVLSYIILYGAERFWVEMLRTDSLEVLPGLRVSQLIALSSVLAAVVLKIVCVKKSKGKNLQVALAVSNWKKYQSIPKEEIDCVTCLPASASRKSFIDATTCLNDFVKSWTPASSECSDTLQNSKTGIEEK